MSSIARRLLLSRPKFASVRGLANIVANKHMFNKLKITEASSFALNNNINCKIFKNDFTSESNDKTELVKKFDAMIKNKPVVIFMKG